MVTKRVSDPPQWKDIDACTDTRLTHTVERIHSAFTYVSLSCARSFSPPSLSACVCAPGWRGVGLAVAGGARGCLARDWAASVGLCGARRAAVSAADSHAHDRRSRQLASRPRPPPTNPNQLRPETTTLTDGGAGGGREETCRTHRMSPSRRLGPLRTRTSRQSDQRRLHLSQPRPRRSLARWCRQQAHQRRQQRHSRVDQTPVARPMRQPQLPCLQRLPLPPLLRHRRRRR